MFRINRKTDYAIRVLICLAKQPFDTRLSTQEIQLETAIPRPFLQRIIADLSRAGLAQTFAGPRGGLQLTHPPAEINLRQAWESVEGPIWISECLQHPQDCPLQSGCPVLSHWARLQCLVTRELEGTTIAQLVEEVVLMGGGEKPPIHRFG